MTGCRTPRILLRIFSFLVLATAIGGPGTSSRASAGEVRGPFEWKSEIYPGTIREYWVYVPEQYRPDKPACVLVVQDGINRARNWNMVEALDQLIAAGDVPVMIGIFINPGVVPAPNENAQPRFNRSFEYDALGDRYARFLIEEILPEVGKSYKLSSDPNDRMIAGASSGAICAFNVAWERPDQFRRVLSTIGTYVGLRGGNEFPVLVRKTESKPIRVFLQDGSNDLNIYAGDWWIANQDMLSALKFSGYDVRHVWGDGGHDGKQAAEVMPDALRWLWRDYPDPVAAGTPARRRMELLVPGEEWELVSQGHRFTEGPAVSAGGELFFTDIPNNRIYRVDAAGQVSVFAEETGRANGLMFGPDGRLFACAGGKRQIVAYRPDGSIDVIVSDVDSNDLVVTPAGIYFTDPNNKRVHFTTMDSRVRVVDTGIERPNGIAVSPDQTQLYVADTLGQFVYSFMIQPDGSLAHKEPFYHLHNAFGRTGSGADGMTVDTTGNLYVTTQLGLQVCDPPGRVHWILPRPQNAWLSNVVLGGPDRDTLFITCGDKVYKRKVSARGFDSWGKPVTPPRPSL